MESQIARDMTDQQNKTESTQVQEEDGGSANITPPSPSLLASTDPPSNTDPLSNTNPHSNTTTPNNKRTVNQKWRKRKRKKRLKQTTLTQHQNVNPKHQKLDHSVKVIPQSPVIDLITLQSESSCEEDVVSDGMNGEYDSSCDNNSQNCNHTNQVHSTCNQNSKLDYTFVPDSSQNCDTENQDFIPLVQAHDNINQNNSQVSNLMQQNYATNHNYTSTPDTTHVNSQYVASKHLGLNGQNSNEKSTNSANHTTTVNQHLKDQR